MEAQVLFFSYATPDTFPSISETAQLLLKSYFMDYSCCPFLETCFTPFTVLSFLTSASRCPVSLTMMVSVPENSPSCESMPMLSQSNARFFGNDGSDVGHDADVIVSNYAQE